MSNLSSPLTTSPDLRALDGAAVAREVRATTLTSFLLPWIARFDEVDNRQALLWPWCLNGIRKITLPCVDRAHGDHLADTKMLSVMFTTLVDDIADVLRDEAMFDAAWRIAEGAPVSGTFDMVRHRYLDLTRDVWRELWARAASYPRFAELETFLRFDYRQIMNALHYDLLVNQSPAALNLTEHDLYMTHSLTVMFMATLDLAATPEFDMAELGAARSVFWEAQRMARIGNTIMSWQREVRSGDTASGVFAYALELGIIKPDDLLERPPAELEQTLLRCDYDAWARQSWERHRDAMRTGIARVHSVDLSGMIEGHTELFRLHRGARELGL